ncbi:MAG: glycoside hydrolase 105 family protein, partial [Lachnospiraceae bacterium]|nr:glycoside hydrolase 105 family protein [Lachnospiraceae bacterium]
MNQFVYKGNTALDYAKQACDTLMRKFSPEDLPPKGRFHYHQGVFLSGMQKTYELCKEEVYYTYIKKWVDSIVLDNEAYEYETGQLDDIQPGVLLFLLYDKTGNEAYKKVLYRLISIVKNFPKNSEGGLWHKDVCPEQMWLDGLYMAGPICAQFGLTFADNSLFDLCIFQAMLMEKKTKDDKTGLWYHAWDSSKRKPWADPVTGLSSEFWGRSLGWVPVAILDELDYIPKEYKGRNELIDLTVDLIKAVCNYQDEKSGLWYQVVNKGDQKGNWLESSCTCLFVAAICKAVRTGLLEEDYLGQAKKGYEGIIDRLRYDEQGVIIDNICVGTGVGNYEHYCARPTSENDLHGVGAYL